MSAPTVGELIRRTADRLGCWSVVNAESVLTVWRNVGMNPSHAVFSIVVDDRATQAHTGLILWNVQPIREIALDQIAWHGLPPAELAAPAARTLR